MSNRIASKRYKGVSYRESSTQKHKGKPDRTYSYTVRDAGQRKYIKVGKASEGITEEAVNKIRQAALAKLNEGERIPTFTEKKEQTLDRIMEAYLVWRESEGSSTKEDQSRYNTHIRPVFGPLQIPHITLERLDRFKADKQTVLAPASVKRLLTLCRAAINFAISRKLYTGINPFERRSGLMVPAEKNKGERFLTHDEAQALLKELELRSTPLYHMAFVSLHTGMRSTEIFGLKGSDIDVNNSVATITAKGGRRETVILRPQVLGILLQHRTTPEALLFPNTKGDKRKEIPDTFIRAVNYLGLNASAVDRTNKVWFHTLRHTFASWLAQSGDFSLHEIMQYMRHKSIDMTLRYAHLIPDKQHEKLSVLDKFMTD